jgi:cytochrome c551
MVAAMRRVTVPALAISAALGLAACGGGGGGGGKTNGSGNDPKSLFAGTCGGCHVLQAAGTRGTFGPDLDQRKPSKDQVLHAIESGPGPMPAHLLRGEQADAVSAYVASVAGK